MRKIVGLFLAASALLSFAYAAEWSGAWKPLRASYTIYSGELAGRDAPTAKERMMTILIDGAPAKEIFDSIAPDIHPTCSEEKGEHERRKKGITCTYSSQGTSKRYRCWLGLDLRTGDSTPTVSC